MAQPNALTVVIFLDDVTELNGPIVLVPGSHRGGVIEPLARGGDSNNDALMLDAYSNSPAWISNLTATLKYTIDQQVLAELISRYGTVAPKGPAGSVLFFHSNLVHGSGTNISPRNRVLSLITYNSVRNVPQFPEDRRPEFLASSDARPLERLEQSAGMAAVSSIAV
jgi:ectoine hydroxylase